MSLNERAGAHWLGAAFRRDTVPRYRHVQVQNFGETMVVVARAARLRELGHGEIERALTHQGRGKGQVADNQAIADVPGELEHFRSGGGDENLRRSCRRQAQEGLRQRIEMKKFREVWKSPK